ncbi:MAG: DUF7544 domain-containing protein [Planctomycetota bacterium]|jgi:hypothetical protein
MAPQQTGISVIDPISPAIDRVKLILFQPFDLARWFVIGFCAWLAYLGSAGGAPNFNFSFNPSDRQHPGGFQPNELLDRAKDFVNVNLHWVVPAAVIGIIILVILWLLIVWLSSRGRFMFLHCVAQNKAEIKVPWNRFRQHANSLFLFRIVIALIGFGIMFLLGLTALLFFLAARGSRTPVFLPVLLIIAIGVPVCIILSLAFLLIHKFTNDFVAPIMFLNSASCVAAWRQFWALLVKNSGKFAVYILFQILIVMAISVIGTMIALLFSCVLLCLTCGVACCFMGIPILSIPFTYVIAVLLLPLSVFKRSYSLFYFRQFGAQFDVFGPEISPPGAIVPS